MRRVPYSSLLLLCLCDSVTAQDWAFESSDIQSPDAVLMNGEGQTVLVSQTVDGARIEILDPFGDSVATFDLDAIDSPVLRTRTAALDDDDSILVGGRIGLDPWVSSWNPALGTLNWDLRPLPVGLGGSVRDIVRTENGYYFSGWIRESGGDENGFVAAYADDLSLLWRRRIGPFDLETRVVDAVGLEGGDLVLAMLREGDPILMRVDAMGNGVWSREIEVAGYQTRMAVTVATNGQILATTDRSPGGAVWVGKFDADGTLVRQGLHPNFTGPDRIEAAHDGGAFIGTRVGDEPALLHLDEDLDFVRGTSLSSQELQRLQFCVLPDDSVVAAWLIGFPGDLTTLGRIGAYGGSGTSCFATVTVFGSSTVDEVVSPGPLELANILGSDSRDIVTRSTEGASAWTPSCGDPCTTTSNFCAISPNSVGFGARIRSNGSVSLAANDLQLVTTGVPAGAAGLYLHSRTVDATPLGEGVLCVGGSIRRLPVVFADAQGTLVHDFDAAAGGAIAPGETWYFQSWYRDVPGGPAGFNLSNGLTTTWCP